MTTTPSRGVEHPSQAARARIPRLPDVLLEQLRAIGLALRIPMLIAVTLAVLATVILAIQIVSGDVEANLLTEPSAFPAVIGALLPIAVWAREERFGPGFIWTLPVDRMRHALIKVLAGWIWLMGGVVLYALSLLVLGIISGDAVLPVETLYIFTADVPRAAPIDPVALRTVQWAPGPLIWAVPFGAATAAYTFASAFMLGARRPLRWVVGAVLLIPVATVASHAASRLLGVRWLADAPERARLLLGEGRYGVDTLLKLRTWTLDRRATLPSGDGIHVWSELPDLGDWGIAALLWIGAGLIALWAAASRHRERRRA
jgi:hypothetical protein